MSDKVGKMREAAPGYEASTAKRKSSKANEGDERKFNDLLDGGKGEKSVAAAKGGGMGMSDLFGQAVQGILGEGQRAGPGAGIAAAVAESGAPVAASSTCEALVERILTSQPAADGGAEVRIKVDSSWLPDTEIRLVRTPDMKLDVEFQSNNVDSQRFLMPNLPNLRESLANRLDGQVVVRMSESASAGDGQSHDGRSRERRNLFEEIGE